MNVSFCFADCQTSLDSFAFALGENKIHIGEILVPANSINQEHILTLNPPSFFPPLLPLPPPLFFTASPLHLSSSFQNKTIIIIKSNLTLLLKNNNL